MALLKLELVNGDADEAYIPGELVRRASGLGTQSAVAIPSIFPIITRGHVLAKFEIVEKVVDRDIYVARRIV